MVEITSYIQKTWVTGARKGGSVTYVEGSSFNLHGFQDFLYCTLIDEIAEGLPVALVRRFVVELRAESGGWTAIRCGDDRILVRLRFRAAKDGRIVGGRVKVIRYKLRPNGFQGRFEGVGAFGAEGIPLLHIVRVSKRMAERAEVTNLGLLVQLRTLLFDAPRHRGGELLVGSDLVLVMRVGDPQQSTHFELFKYGVRHPLHPGVEGQNIYGVPCGCR